MKCKCFINSEYFISFGDRKVDGCVEFNVERCSSDTLNFSFSSSVVVNSVTFNGKPAFFSRAPYNGDENSNFHVFLPIGFESSFWSPIPSFSKKKKCSIKRNFTLKIDFTINESCPSITWYKNFVYTNSHPFGTQGWMPKLLEDSEKKFGTLKISVDRPDLTIFGAFKVSETTKRRADEKEQSVSFDLKHLVNTELLGWAIGELNLIEVKQFKIYFLDHIEQNSFSFLTSFPETPKDPSPIIIVPDLPNDALIYSGFALLNDQMLCKYSSFRSTLLIPSSYHLIVAISYIFAVDLYGNVSDFCDFAWLFVGLMSVKSRKFYSSVLGKSNEEFYDWSMIRYLHKIGSNDGATNKLNCYSWDLDSSQRLRAHYVMNIVFANIREAKNDEFIESIPQHLDNEILVNFLSPYITESELFIQYWFSGVQIPVYNVSISWETKRFQTNVIANVSLEPILNQKTKLCLPMTAIIYSVIGGYKEDVMVPIAKKCSYEFDLMRRKPRAKKGPVDPKENVPVDFLLFPLVESNPRVPSIIMYDIDTQMLINIVKSYHLSVYAQHEALASLHRRFLEKSADAGLITEYLNILINDDSAFFSLRCHAIHILGDVMCKNKNLDISSAAKNVLIDFFTSKIAGERTTKLQDISSIHPCIIVTIFRNIALDCNVPILSPYQYISNAITQLSGTILEPYLIECTSFVEMGHEKEWNSLSEFLLDKIKDSDDPLTKCISLGAYERFVVSLPNHIRDYFINSLSIKLDDRSFKRTVKQAIARLVIRWVPNESSITILQNSADELRFESPDYLYIENIMRYLVFALPSWGDDVTSSIKKHANMSLIFENIRFIISKTAQSHNQIYQCCTALYRILFNKEKWPYIFIPDGIIKTYKLDLDKSFDEGMFSDDDEFL